jgi:hypothetical protein
VTQQARQLLVTVAAADATPLPDPRSRQQIQPQLRRRLPQREPRDHSNSGARATGERNRRALRPHRPRRMPRLAPNPRQTAPRTGAPRLRSALQRPPAAQGTQPHTARPSSWNPARAQRIMSSKAPTNRSTGRTHPRIQPRGLRTGFAHPTGSSVTSSCSPGTGTGRSRNRCMPRGSRRRLSRMRR